MDIRGYNLYDGETLVAAAQSGKGKAWGWAGFGPLRGQFGPYIYKTHTSALEAAAGRAGGNSAKPVFQSDLTLAIWQGNEARIEDCIADPTLREYVAKLHTAADEGATLRDKIDAMEPDEPYCGDVTGQGKAWTMDVLGLLAPTLTSKAQAGDVRDALNEAYRKGFEKALDMAKAML